MTTRSARNASTRCSHCPHDACRPLAVDAAADSPHRQAGSRWDRSIAHILERSAVDDGHAPSRHRAAPLRRAQGCLQTRAPTALLSTAMQPAPSASSMPALTGATVDAVERGHAASPCLQGAGGYLRPSAAPQWAPALGATVASPRRQSLPALPADSCTQPWEQACVQGRGQGMQTRSARWHSLLAGVCSPVSAVSGRRG